MSPHPSALRRESAARAVPALRLAAAQEAPPAAAQASVFLVAEAAAERGQVGARLQAIGCSVRAFGSAEELLAALAAGAPDCVVIVPELPGMDSSDLLHLLGARPAPVPAMVVSLGADPRLLRRLQAAGLRELLALPFSDAQLHDALRRLTAA